MTTYNLTKTFNKLLEEKEKEKKKNQVQSEQAKESAMPEIKVETTENSEAKAPKTFNASEEKINPLKELTAEQAIDEAKKIAQKYNSGNVSNAPETLELEKIKIEEKDDNDFIEEAKKSLQNKYELSKDKTDQSFKTKINNLIAENESHKKKSEENQNKINQYFDQSIKETENQALKRGLARSSIVIGELSSIEESRANELAQILKDYQQSLDENEKQMKALEEQKENALSTLDIEMALDVEEKIQKLKQEYNKTKEDAIKFNNNVTKLQAEYQLDREKQNQSTLEKTLSMDNKYKTNFYENQIKQSQFEYLQNYLDSLEPEYSLDLLLTNKELKKILGDNYSLMYRHIKNKI